MSKSLTFQWHSFTGYGHFEHGFKQAIEIIEGIAKNGKHQESRDAAEIFVKLLEKCLPEVMASAPDLFSFDIIEDPSGKPKISFH